MVAVRVPTIAVLTTEIFDRPLHGCSTTAVNRADPVRQSFDSQMKVSAETLFSLVGEQGAEEASVKRMTRGVQPHRFERREP